MRERIIGCLLALASAATQAGPGHQAHDERAADGGALYHQYCSVCHGDRGDGHSRARGSLTPPPRDFTTPRAAGELTRGRMIAAIMKGSIPHSSASRRTSSRYGKGYATRRIC